MWRSREVVATSGGEVDVESAIVEVVVGVGWGGVVDDCGCGFCCRSCGCSWRLGPRFVKRLRLMSRSWAMRWSRTVSLAVIVVEVIEVVVAVFLQRSACAVCLAVVVVVVIEVVVVLLL